MDTQEIIDGNRIIAHTMGYEESGALVNYFNTPNGLELVHFHEDYSWLMKAVKHIITKYGANFSYNNEQFMLTDSETKIEVEVQPDKEVYCAWKCVCKYLIQKNR